MNAWIHPSARIVTFAGATIQGTAIQVQPGPKTLWILPPCITTPKLSFP